MLQLRRLPDNWCEVRGERLRSAKKSLGAHVQCPGHAVHRFLHKGRHPLPIGLNITKGEVLRNVWNLPRGCTRLKQAHHKAVTLGADICIARGVLDHRPVPAHLGHRVRDEVVVFAGLVGDVDTRPLPELPRPHTGGVHHVVRAHVTPARRVDARHSRVFSRHALHPHPLYDTRAVHLGPLGQCHDHVHGVRTAVLLHIKAGLHVICATQGKEPLHLLWPDLPDVDTREAIVGSDPPKLFQAVLVRCQLDEANRLEARGLPRLRLQRAV
mmetsp:Transcript_32453/g.90862  ORF Transcript_32453/g.90862 Transcript_32453/m.90862 type:complete len:269 (-) Transcript_32453:171-977(-)